MRDRFFRQRPACFTPRPAPHRRAGLLIFELVVTCVLLGTVFCIALPFIMRIQEQRRATRRELAGAAVLQTAMDRLTGEPWEALTTEAANELLEDAQLAAHLPEAELRASIDGLPEEPAAKRVQLQLRWRSAQGPAMKPFRLTTWVYQRGEPGP